MKGFDNNKYLSMQSQHIKKRISEFGGKLYLEFGGKLFDDYHASRVLPGFEPDSKVKLLKELSEQVEIVIVINACDIEKNKVRGDLDITYDVDVLRLIDNFRNMDLFVGSVVISQYDGQHSADLFSARLQNLGIKVFTHYKIDGYPTNISHIVSDDGLGKNDYITTERPLVVVTAPGPGSGKMATCLSQLFHEHKNGISAGYAKFETFPIWNLPLKHPVNIAYEAATADLNDINMIDPFHLEAYDVKAINYNRDIEIFPVLNAIFERIAGKSPYKSPTDMGVNMAGNCIDDDDVVCKFAKDEIIRRYYTALCDKRQGKDSNSVPKIELLLSQANINTDDREIINIANAEENRTGAPSIAIKLADGRIITGKTTGLLGASSGALLNCLKVLAGLREDIHLIPPIIIEPIQKLKIDSLGNKNPRLHTDEVLIALSISAATNPLADMALSKISGLKGAEAHSTVILSSVDLSVFKKLGVNVSCEPKYQSNNLYQK